MGNDEHLPLYVAISNPWNSPLGSMSPSIRAPLSSCYYIPSLTWRSGTGILCAEQEAADSCQIPQFEHFLFCFLERYYSPWHRGVWVSFASAADNKRKCAKRARLARVLCKLVWQRVDLSRGFIRSFRFITAVLDRHPAGLAKCQTY